MLPLTGDRIRLYISLVSASSIVAGSTSVKGLEERP